MYGNQYPPQGPPPGYFQNNPFPKEPPKDKPIDLWKIVGINFGIFMAYQALFVFIASDAFLVADMFPLVLHWLVMIIFMIISFSIGKKMTGFGWLISLVTLLLIGFGSCWWIADVVGGSGMF